MSETRKPGFPAGSLLAALLCEAAPVDLRRAARRLRAEGAHALWVEDDIAALAEGLAASGIAQAAAVAEALPPLFWVEVERAGGTAGWIVERRPGGLSARGFRRGAAPDAAPVAEGAFPVLFAGMAREEDGESRAVRGLLTAIALPELMSQMGESAPVLLLPAEPPEREAAALRGLRLSVALPRDAAPQ